MAIAAYDIAGAPDLDDRRQLTWQGLSADFRATAPFGFTLAVERHVGRIDEITGAVIRDYNSDLTLAFDREVVPNVIAAFNLIYQPDWTRFVATGAAVQEATIGGSFGHGTGPTGPSSWWRSTLFAEL